MKRACFLLVSILFTACSTATTIAPTPTITPAPTSMPSPTATLVPTLTITATPTPTPIGGTLPTATSAPVGKGYAFEFTHEVASGFATLHGAAHTCTGLHGPWDGTFEVMFTAERLQASGSGTFQFTLPPDSLYVSGKAPYSGSGVAGRCAIADVSGPLTYELTFSPNGRTVDVIMGSAGAETITIVCPDITVTIPFAIAWGPDPLTVPITLYNDCP
ncbi:hypothetical protein [Chloroflexus sp.]|uniref:hypothetical protein n=1 Tax=Chloroflexus sp. TaxID=1904827 RepID=UPI00298EE169|nr:hypothetical protein [Chloroflexus sp.]MDW8404101.1 hypothetical protein [Chloroflexus sp.]